MSPTDLLNFARRTGWGFVCATAFTLPALALNPDYQIAQYAHTSWGSDSGIEAVRRIKQTPDGYLWLATRVGLMRFDGVRVSTFRAGSEEGLESSTMQDLWIDPDGSMWVATLGGGVAHYQAGKFHTYTGRNGLPSDDISSLFRDSRGTLWVGTRGAGIARMVGGRFETLPLAIPPGPITAFLEGPDRSLWIATFRYGVFRLQNGTLTSFTVQNGLPDNRVAGLYRDRSGTIWTAGWKGISSWNGTRFVGYLAVNAVVSYAISCTEDRDGNLWIASSSGLFRAHATEVAKTDRIGGLSSDFASDVFEDREGNLWVGTRGGLDRFRDEQVRMFNQPGPIVVDAGGVWTVSNRQITRIAATTIRNWPVSLPRGTTPLTLMPEPDAGFLIGFENGAKRWSGEHANSPSELSGLDVRSLLRARDGTVWIGTANRGLLRWRPSAGSQTLSETGVPDRFIATLAEDRSGVVWAGSTSGGGLYRLTAGSVQHFGRAEGLRSPDVYTVFVDGKGELWIGSTGGLSWFQDGRIRTVNSQQGLPADQVFAIVEDSYDQLWFCGFGGIAAIDKKSLAEWASGPRPKRNPILYRSAEGLQIRTATSFFPNAARSANGHLWFAIADGLVEVTPPDPAASRASQFGVLVEDVTIDNVEHSPLGHIRIPPRARSIELRYTALTLSNSQAVRFRYRLEGFDNDWVDADTRRLAFYNNLRPGAYTFRAAASVGEAQWQESPALVLEQLPFFYQTRWFMLISSGATLSLAFFLYRLRLRQAVDRVQTGFQQRLDERTRIARDLHDTLLQSFQGVSLKFSALKYMMRDRPDEAEETLERIIDQVRAAIVEGRDAVQGLRASTVVANDLARAIATLGKGLATDQAGQDCPEFNVQVEGKSRDLPPFVRDEVFHIACESLRNAFRHAQAKRIEVEFRYDPRQFRLRVVDNGRGVDPTVLSAGGRAGHHGLSGIKERAELAGGKLSVRSQLDSGTEIELTIPASIAYSKSPLSRRSRSSGQGSG